MHSLLYFSPRGMAVDDAAVQARAEASGLAVADLRLRLRGGRLAVLARAAAPEELRVAAHALEAQGDAAAVVDDGVLRALPPARLARALRIGSSRIEFLGADGQTLATLPKGTPVTMVVANLQLPVGAPQVPPGAGSASAAADVRREGDSRLRKMFARETEGVVIDLAWAGGPGRLRIRGGRFQFASLGAAAGPAASVNLRALLEVVARHSGQALLDLEQARVAAPLRGLLVMGQPNGGEFDHPVTDVEADFEHYSRFVHTAAQQGLFQGLLDAPEAEGAAPPWRLTRALPPAVPAVAGTTAAQRPRWTPPGDDGAAPLRRRVEGLARLGPPLVLAPLLGVAGLGFLAASATPRVGAVGLGLVPLGVALLVHAWALFERLRRVEDVPTSKIRSAAMGPVEICGATAPLFSLCTPFSLLPCVYYEFTVTREVAGRVATGIDGPYGLARWASSRASDEGRAERWHGSSGPLPFLLRDDTGVVEVDPAGALVDISCSRVLHNPPLAAGLTADGSRVTVVEKFIPLDHPVYVMGELQRLEGPPGALRPDIGRTDRVVVGRPARGGLFLVSERSEHALLEALKPRIYLALTVGSALVAVGAWELTRLAWRTLR